MNYNLQLLVLSGPTQIQRPGKHKKLHKNGMKRHRVKTELVITIYGTDTFPFMCFNCVPIIATKEAIWSSITAYIWGMLQKRLRAYGSI